MPALLKVLFLAVVMPLYAAMIGLGAPPASAFVTTETAQSLAGVYSVAGRNPNGSAYSGQVVVEVSNGAVFFRWDIAGQTYRGQGTLEGKVLTIDWGETDPVIYVLQPDGSLDGTWARGRASERLVKIR